MKPPTLGTPSLSLVADADDAEAHSNDLVHEIIHNRDIYYGGDGGVRHVISRLPRVLERSLSIIEHKIDTRIGHTGLNLIAVAALTEGHKLLVDDPKVKRLMDARGHFSDLDSHAINRELWKEADLMLKKFEVFVVEDNYGGERFDIYNVPQDTTTNINTARQRLSMRPGPMRSVCVALCLAEQECLSRETRGEIQLITDSFKRRVALRLTMFEGVVGLVRASKKGVAKRKVSRSKRARRSK